MAPFLRFGRCDLVRVARQENCDEEMSTRTSGRQWLTNVSKELLNIDADTNGDNTLDRVNLFSDQLPDYDCQHDNNGVTLAQLRFYEVPVQ